MKHYGKFLSWAGNPVKYLSNDLELMYMRKERLEKELSDIILIIEGKEKEFLKVVQNDWTAEEIEEAKLKAQEI